MREIRHAVNSSGKAVLWRNNIGWDEIHGVKYGLAKGSADLIGFIFSTGQFLALEVKSRKGRLEPEQEAWLGFVNKNGGLASVVKSVKEALDALEKR